MRRLLTLCALALWPHAAAAQDAQTLADIRQELSVLSVELQRLNSQLNTTGAANPNLAGTSVL